MVKVNAYYTILRGGAVEVRCFIIQDGKRMPTGILDFAKEEFERFQENLTEVNWINDTLTQIGN